MNKEWLQSNQSTGVRLGVLMVRMNDTVKETAVLLERELPPLMKLRQGREEGFMIRPSIMVDHEKSRSICQRGGTVLQYKQKVG